MDLSEKKITKKPGEAWQIPKIIVLLYYDYKIKNKKEIPTLRR